MMKYKTNMLKAYQPSKITRIEAERISEVLSKDEGRQYKFISFLNGSRPSLAFECETGEQRILAENNAKHILGK